MMILIMGKLNNRIEKLEVKTCIKNKDIPIVRVQFVDENKNNQNISKCWVTLNI